MEFINFEAEDVQNRDSTPLNHSSQTADDNHGMQLWNEKQYGAWVMMGTTSIISALYWMQYYYYHYWYGSYSKYAATESKSGRGYMKNAYTMWGLAESINAITLLFQWIPSAIVWILTATNVDGIIWFFVVWTGVMHYVDAFRFVIVSIIKIVAFWYDSDTAVNSYSGLEQTYKVSKSHSLAYWDFAMEWMGFMVSFGMYLDLHTIIEDMEVYERRAIEERRGNGNVVVAGDKDDDLRF